MKNHRVVVGWLPWRWCLRPDQGRALSAWTMGGFFFQFIRPRRICDQVISLWLFNIAMGNGPFIDGLPIKQW